MDNFSAIGSHISHQTQKTELHQPIVDPNGAHFSRAPSAVDPLMANATSQPFLIQQNGYPQPIGTFYFQVIL